MESLLHSSLSHLLLPNQRFHSTPEIKIAENSTRWRKSVCVAMWARWLFAFCVGHRVCVALLCDWVKGWLSLCHLFRNTGAKPLVTCLDAHLKLTAIRRDAKQEKISTFVRICLNLESTVNITGLNFFSFLFLSFFLSRTGKLSRQGRLLGVAKQHPKQQQNNQACAKTYNLDSIMQYVIGYSNIPWCSIFTTTKTNSYRRTLS